MCVDVYYTYVVVPVVSAETRIIYMYVYYTSVLVPGDPFQLLVSVIYYPRIRESEICVLASPAIWWRSV
jgi:hypothetical protein